MKVAEMKNKVKSNSRNQNVSKDEPSFDNEEKPNDSSSLSSSSGDDKTVDNFKEGMCNPSSTSEQDRGICEDLFITLCNPDDIAIDEADDTFCNWLGFTSDVDWNDDGEEEDLLYAKYDSSSTVLSSASADTESSNHQDNFKHSMCTPESIKPHHEDLCDDIWLVVCAPHVEQPVDDAFCDWVGYTEDVDLNYAEDEWFGSSSYDSTASSSDFDWRKRNLRGERSN